MATKESVVYFCPQCGGATLDFSEIGGDASCRTCNWTGPAHERVAYPFRHDFISDESVLLSMVNDMRIIFSASAKLWGDFLLKWGFISQNPRITRDLTRYLARSARAVLTAIVEERELLEKEEHGKRN